MTMPAMLPPDNPCAWGALAVALEDGVAVGNRVPIEVVNGSFTPWQRVSVPENRQQESVEFGELAAQYEQRLGRLLLKPQLSGSFNEP